MPNSNQVSPEAVDEERESNRPTSNMEHAAVGVGHPHLGVGIGRRDENSISFRHFLQPHSDLVPAPAPSCRRTRGAQAGAVDLVDMAMALPDFVQDHLVVESLAITDQQNEGVSSHSGASSLDLSVLSEILPDFATSQSSAQSGHSRRRNMPDESLVAPEISHGAAGSSALPDFLSDGPMQCTDTNVVDNSMSGPSSSRTTSRILASSSLTERNRIVDESSRSTSFDSSESLRAEVERLRRDISERNRRISQLEGEVLRLRTNTNVLENALRTAEQNVTESEIRRLDIERENESLRRHLSKRGAVGGDTSSASSSRVTVNGGITNRVEIDPYAVQDIAQSSEALISHLLQNMARLKRLVTTENHRTEDHAGKSSDGDENKNN